MSVGVDPLALAVDWLDAYRAGDLNEIVALYDEDAAIECGCGGQTVVVGLRAIREYWRQRLIAHPAFDLEDIQPNGLGVSIDYRVDDGIVRTTFELSEAGKISRVRCGPAD